MHRYTDHATDLKHTDNQLTVLGTKYLQGKILVPDCNTLDYRKVENISEKIMKNLEKK